MTLQFMDGFTEYQNVRTDPAWIGTTTLNTQTGRDGNLHGAIIANISTPIARLITPSATVVAGLAYSPTQWASGGSTNDLTIGFCTDNNTTLHVIVLTGPNGTLQARRGYGGTLLGESAINTVPLSVYHYIEAKCTIADSGGNITVRVDGTEVINFTGDTRNGGTLTDIDAVRILGSNQQRGIYDDMYCLNTAGSAPYNDWLGDVRVVRLLPNGNGASSQLLGSDGDSTDNYQLVDEFPGISTSDYVTSSTPGNRDLYEMTDLPVSGLVYATQPVYYATKTDSGARSLKPIQRSSGGTVASSTTVAAVFGSYMLHTGDLRTTDPAGAALSVANTNGQQVGVEVV